MGKIKAVLLSFLFLLLPVCALAQNFRLHDYMLLLEKQQPCIDTHTLVRITDKSKVNTKMNAEQIQAFMGGTLNQARMVISLSGNRKTGLTPIEFCHVLKDDFFSRKALQHLVKQEDKDAILLRLQIMEDSACGKLFTKEEIDRIVLEYGHSTPLQLN